MVKIASPQTPEPVKIPKPSQFQLSRSGVPVEKLSSEVLVISAVINSGDVGGLTTCGITAEHFRGWVNQFNWILRYVERFEGQCPTPDAFLTQYPDFPLAAHDDVRSACDMLLATYYKNRGQETILEAAELFKNDEVHEAAALMQSFQVREVASARQSLVSDQTFLDVYFDTNEEQGIPFPYAPLQKATGGFRPGNYMILAARPGQGKSSISTDIAVNAVSLGKKVKYYSLEMTDFEMRYKVHAKIAHELGFKNITARALLDRRVDRDEYKKLLEAIQGQDRWADFDVHTPRNGMVTPVRVMSDIEEYDMVVVDLVSLMANNKGQRAIQDWRIAAEISNELKQIALSSKVPILATSQINRDGAMGNNAPRLDQLSQSDSLGQDADVVLTMRNVENVALRMGMEKVRFGSGSSFNLQFDPDHMHFPVITEEKFQELTANAKDD